MTPADRRERIEFCALVHALRSLPCPAIVAIDGWSGSGKTWLASHVVAQLGGTGLGWTVIHMDDFVPGWDGLSAGVAVVHQDIALPLARGETARARVWDWHDSRPGVELEFRPQEGLILEGSGSIAATGELATLGIWIDLDEAHRRRRLRRRSDYEAYAPYIDHWAGQERAIERECDSMRRADLVVAEVGRDSLVLERASERGRAALAPPANTR
ncbi:hypothetical protein GCM10010401_11030 [Rarobacter faecitabidus]|uniref:Uridine kinase n=1 Tax=Rarobacter faecitabidus TaxID=13243 RepID=A0A542ZP54_RARFA|nr:hypothetical protein [Rarobacter faecitabidus]TQL62154.1 uridine kinase [Rarobacter faecitabidus]